MCLQVLLIGHIPPGDEDNWPEYGQLYLNVTKQFKDTIVGHLYGHTHMDQFQLVRSYFSCFNTVRGSKTRMFYMSLCVAKCIHIIIAC